MHTIILAAILLLAGNALPASRFPRQRAAKGVRLPDNPCEVLSRTEMSVITGLDVTTARVIPDLGLDAWLAGGADLYVLVQRDEYFVLSTQTYQRQSRELLVKVANAILDRR